MKSGARVYFHNLDLVRFYAFIPVLFAHGFEAWKDYYIIFRKSTEEVNELFSGWLHYVDIINPSLGIGVEIFFFISGFLITYILLKEKEEYGDISLWKFYLRRGLRIWPLYFFMIALGPLFTSWMGIGNPNYPSLLLFYSNFQTIWDLSWEYPFGHFWSIAVEEQFYLVWPLVIGFVPKKHLKPLFFVLIAGSILSRVYYFYDSDRTWMHLFLNTLCRFDTLVIGALIAVYSIEDKVRLNLSGSISILLVLLGIASFVIEPYSSWTTLPAAIGKKYIYLLVFGVPIMNYVLNPRFSHRGWLLKKLSYLGKISLGLYVFHNILVVIVIKKILLNNNLDSWWMFAVIYPLMTILVSIISFELLEKPFLRLKERFARIPTRKF